MRHTLLADGIQRAVLVDRILGARAHACPRCRDTGVVALTRDGKPLQCSTCYARRHAT